MSAFILIVCCTIAAANAIKVRPYDEYTGDNQERFTDVRKDQLNANGGYVRRHVTLGQTDGNIYRPGGYAVGNRGYGFDGRGNILSANVPQRFGYDIRGNIPVGIIRGISQPVRNGECVERQVIFRQPNAIGYGPLGQGYLMGNRGWYNANNVNNGYGFNQRGDILIDNYRRGYDRQGYGYNSGNFNNRYN